MNKTLDLYSDYLIVQNLHSTATGLSELVSGDLRHDHITRFLNRNNFTSKDLWLHVKEDVTKYSTDDGVIILDDSIQEKPYTDENDIVCWHYSHSKGTHVKGANLLSCLVNYKDVSLPIAYEVVHKDIAFSDIETKKTKRKASISKNEHFRNLISQAKTNNVQYKYVLADNWFGAKENFEFINSLDKKFIIGIKSNRTIALSKADKKIGKFQKVQSLDMKDGESKNVFLKGLNFPVQLSKRVFTNEDGSTGILYLVSNDTAQDSDTLYNIYKKRWNIEVYHKSIKQNASLSKSPTKRVVSQLNHIFASIIGFCKLEILKIKTATNHFALKHKMILSANQAAMRELDILRGKNAISA